MKNITGKLIGFILGVAGFLYLFKVFVLVHIPPEDELAPGVVVLASVFSGLFFAFVGNFLQGSIKR